MKTLIIVINLFTSFNNVDSFHEKCEKDFCCFEWQRKRKWNIYTGASSHLNMTKEKKTEKLSQMDRKTFVPNDL